MEPYSVSEQRQFEADLWDADRVVRYLVSSGKLPSRYRVGPSWEAQDHRYLQPACPACGQVHRGRCWESEG